VALFGQTWLQWNHALRLIGSTGPLQAGFDDTVQGCSMIGCLFNMMLLRCAYIPCLSLQTQVAGQRSIPSPHCTIVAVQSSATALRPALVAAHQVLWQVWNLCAFGHTPMEQAALAFLPGTTDRNEYKELVKLLLGVGAVVGAVTAFVATAVPYYLPFLFTPDAQLWPIMKSIAPQVWS